MKFSRQQQAVFIHILAHPGCTVQSIRDATRQRKPDMRISEMNYAYQLSQGIEHPDLKDDSKNLIVNVGRNQFREVLKSIRPLTKTITQVDLIDGKAIARQVQVPI